MLFSLIAWSRSWFLTLFLVKNVFSFFYIFFLKSKACFFLLKAFIYKFPPLLSCHRTCICPSDLGALSINNKVLKKRETLKDRKNFVGFPLFPLRTTTSNTNEDCCYGCHNTDTEFRHRCCMMNEKIAADLWVIIKQ